MCEVSKLEGRAIVYRERVVASNGVAERVVGLEVVDPQVEVIVKDVHRDSAAVGAPALVILADDAPAALPAQTGFDCERIITLA